METLPEGLALDDTRACLVWMAEQFRSGISEADGLSIAASLYVQRREHPDMLARFRGEVILPGREKFVAALQAGVDRGTIRADADLGLVVITHAHADHASLADILQRTTHAQIMLGSGDVVQAKVNETADRIGESSTLISL